MLYDHTEEAKLKRQSLPNLGKRWPSVNPATARAILAAGDGSARTTTTFSSSGTAPGSGGGGRGGDGVLNRSWWPPSHAEIVAGAKNEGLLSSPSGPTIPTWHRGPLLLASKLDFPAPQGWPEVAAAGGASAFLSVPGRLDTDSIGRGGGEMRSGASLAINFPGSTTFTARESDGAGGASDRAEVDESEVSRSNSCGCCYVL